MPTVTTEQVFSRRAEVVAATELPGVPEGTPGKVLYVTGVSWPRYHVLFDNGETVGSVDASELLSRLDWQRRAAQERRAARAERAAARRAARSS